MFQLLVINGEAAPTETELVSGWDGGRVASRSFCVLLLCKAGGIFVE